MTEPRSVVDGGSRAAVSRRSTVRDAANLVEDRRLASLHLRLGSLALARAELEDLGRRGALDGAALADLAEARWRSGDLAGAASAATDHLAAGGSRPVAFVIAAEAAVAAGRPMEARAHVEALGAIEGSALEDLFGGMPRRAFWPTAPSTPGELPDTLFGAVRAGRRGVTTATAAVEVLSDESPGGAAEAPEAMTMWSDGEAAAGLRPARGPRPPASPADDLARARAELGSGNAQDVARGFARLALVLRLDPALAPAVLEVVGPRREVAALLVRADACRLLGRHLDAEAALAAAGQALEGP